MNSSTTRNCVFCQIVSGEAPAKIVFQDDEITAFWDSRPAAPVHILIVPNRHIWSTNALDNEDAALVGRLILRAKALAAENEVDESGYRLFFNTGDDGRQSIYHLHLHLMGGARLPVFHAH